MYLLFQKRQALENNNQLEPRVSNSKIHLIAMKKVEIFQEIKVHEGIKSGTPAHQGDHPLLKHSGCTVVIKRRYLAMRLSVLVHRVRCSYMLIGY